MLRQLKLLFAVLIYWSNSFELTMLCVVTKCLWFYLFIQIAISFFKELLVIIIIQQLLLEQLQVLLPRHSVPF